MDRIFEETLEEINGLVWQNPHDLLLRICHLLKERIGHYDWVGFYISRDGELILGPYVGQPTEHTRIAFGKGICGQVAEKKQTMIIQDVSAEDNYLSCSVDVQSEIVVPVLKDGRFVAELDIDSHSPAPFQDDDRFFLEQVCALIAGHFE